MSQRNDNKTLSQINVTPMVDVMVVILAIFMVTAPLLQHGIKVALPQAATGTLDSKKDELLVTIDKDKYIHILDSKFSLQEFEEKIKHIYKAKTNKKIFLGADKSLPYGYVMLTMAAIKNGGFQEVGLMTEPVTEWQKRTLFRK